MQVLAAPPHSGLSCFLKHCSDTKAGSGVSLYADGAKHEGNSLFAQFGLELFHKYRPLWKDLVGLQEGRAGRTRPRQISAAISESIPYIGRVLARGTELAYPTLPLSAYPSIAAEFLCEFLVRVSQSRQICLFLDNVQELDNWSAQLLSVTAGRAYRGIRYVAGFVTRGPVGGENIDRFVIRSQDIGYGVSVSRFPLPNEEFIQLYAASFDLKWSRSHCAVLAAATGGDIYRIRAALAAACGMKSDLPSAIRDLSPLAQSILGFLALARQDLRRSDVLALCLADDAIFIRDIEDVDRTINELADATLVYLSPLPDGDQLVALLPSPAGVKEALHQSAAVLTRLELHLYDYFSRADRVSGRHSAAEIAPLLYRLASSVDPDHLDTRLRDIIRLSLQMGSRSIAEEFIDRAVRPSGAQPQHLHDYLAKLAFLISVKTFDRVLELTSKPPRKDWGSHRLAQVFRGIALNRRRHHDESEELLASLCATYTSLEELATLVSYRIVGKIHSNDISSARTLYERYHGDLVGAANYGYFLRNGAEVYDASQGVEILTQALHCHEKTSDIFGIATTRCNRGAKLAQIGQPEAGLTDVEYAYDVLEVFGVHHLAITIGDVAHCYLYLRLFEQAEQTCSKALRYMGKELPRAYTLLNMAAAQLLQGRSNDAIVTVEQVINEAEQARLDRVRQKAYFNGALIALFADAPERSVKELCNNALLHPDRRDPVGGTKRVNEILQLLAKGRPASTDLFFSLYSPCSLFYWYQNPLEGLPIDFLSLKTMPQNANDHFPI
ncbi:MAG TPA: hypothetical protein VNW97_14000 [Candidatus Saccharimonadales bacterium]|nr:hypothetical protein [Candidatus Saccharimonadales bacterium]